jgi:cell division protein FtsW
MADTTLPPQYIDDEYDDAFELEQRVAERRRRFTATIDTYLVLTVGVLVAIGLMMVWSTTFFWSEPQSAIFMQQVRNAVIGFILMIVLTIIDYRIWRRLAIPMMGVVIVALLGLLVLPGVQARFGAKRAYFDGAVQPSESAMLAVIIYMAAWLSSKQSKIRYLTYGLLPFALLVGTIAGLIVLEPDLSTAALICLTAAIMFFLAGADWIQLGITAFGFGGVGFLAVTQLDYARARLQSFLDLLRDPIQAQAAHAQAVIIAFLNGGLGGVGLGQSYQKFFNLSTPHTDAIFAVIGEELGLIGCALVVALYVVLLIRGFRIARNAPDLFGALLAAGVTVSIVLEALFNVAVMASAVPFVGVPLPFISFGGSSLVSAMASVGLLLSVSRATVRQATPTRKTNETLNLPGVRGSITRVRQRPVEDS